MAQADGSVILDTKMNNDALEKGFERLKTDCESLGITCEKVGNKINAAFADVDVSANLQNAVYSLETAQRKLEAATDNLYDAQALGDTKQIAAWANKRAAAYEKVEQAQRRLTQVIASEAEKQARAEEKAAKQAAKVVEQEANTKESAISSMFDSAGESASKFSSRLKRIAAGAFVFNIIRSGLRSVTQYFGNALMANTQFSTALNRLNGSLMVAFQPIYEAVLPALVTVINWLNVAVQAVARFYAVLSGKSYSQVQSNAIKLNTAISGAGDTIEDAGQQAKEATKYLAGFDEINQMLAEDAESVSNSLGSAGNSDFQSPIFDEVTLPNDMGATIDRLALQLKDIVFDWDNLTAEDITKKLVFGLDTLGAGLIGFSIGGIPGAIIGVVAGAALSLGLMDGVFNNDGQLSMWELEESLKAVLLPLGTAAIGFVATGGNAVGALVGLTVGTALAFALKGVHISEEDSVVDVNDILELLKMYLIAMGGAAAIGGFIGLSFGPAGAATGAAIGALVGLALTFAVQQTSFDSVEDEFEGLRKKVEKWSQETTDTTVREFISPVKEKTLQLTDDMSLGYEDFKETVGDEFRSAAATGMRDFFAPVQSESTKTSEHIKKTNTKATDKIIENFEKTAQQTETGFMIPTQNQALKTANFISEKFTTAAQKVKDIWTGIPEWFQTTVTGPITEFFNNLTSTVVGGFNKTAQSVSGAIEDLMDSFSRIINYVNGKVSSFKSTASSYTSKSSKASTQSASFAVNVMTTPEIPALARGAVIPPNHKFLAVLGDQKSGTNIEAPLETIKQALAEVLGESGMDVDINFTGSLSQLARVLTPEITKRQRQTDRAKGG